MSAFQVFSPSFISTIVQTIKYVYNIVYLEGTAKLSKKLGIIQTRGLGDIIIALPIALHYHEQGYHVHWPVVDSWVEQLTAHSPWVKWIPIKPDSGPFFYDTPMERLKNFKMDEIICLYQALTGHPEFINEPWFQHTAFDQYKYIRAGVAFKDKLRLPECITRDHQRESTLYNQIIGEDATPYVVTHLSSSEQTVTYDPEIIPQGWRVIPISNQGRIFDWIKIIEGAEAVIMTDSVFANLVDGLDVQGPERYFIPQHHIQLTATLLGNWSYLHNPDLKPQARIFGAG